MSHTSDLDLRSLRPALAELERAAAWTYARMGISGAPRVTVSIQTKGKKASCLAWFSTDRWTTREGEAVHEVNVTAEVLDRDPVELVAYVIHEVVHLSCHVQGIKDCSKSGRHNKRFKAEAERFGLVVTQNTNGWAWTEPTPDLATAIMNDFQPDVAAFALFRNLDPKKESTTKTIAWICSCQGEELVTVRTAAGKVLDAECRRCGSFFWPKDQDRRPEAPED